MSCLHQILIHTEEHAAGTFDVLKVIFLEHVTGRTQISLLLYPSANAA